MVKNNQMLKVIATTAMVLALVVVMLGAYTRLTDAGLGCPDWPGCYGQMVLPSAEGHLKQAQSLYPSLPIEPRKAWTEMAHRYVAGTLGLLIFALGFMVIKRRSQGMSSPWRIPALLMLLVLFQAALGMWTVTLKLLPVVVMGHLLGGILIFALLTTFRAQLTPSHNLELSALKPWVYLAGLIVFIQIALGGWVSANYAGISCVGFPQCNGVLWPKLYLLKAFNLFSSIGANYQGGALDIEARITIQFIHRLGAVVTAIYLIALGLVIARKAPTKALQCLAILAIGLVCCQFILGIINVVYILPIQIAVAHNGVAAMLLACVFCLILFIRGKRAYE